MRHSLSQTPAEVQRENERLHDENERLKEQIKTMEAQIRLAVAVQLLLTDQLTKANASNPTRSAHGTRVQREHGNIG